MTVFKVLLIFVTIPLVLSQDLLKSQFPLYGLTEVVAKQSLKSLESECNASLISLHNAIRNHDTWALRMLDSSGTPANGFIWGNNYWLGSYTQCRWLSSKRPRHPMTSQGPLASPPFGVDFFIGLFKQNTKLQAEIDAAPKDVVHLGLCLPSSCSLEELKQLLSHWARQNPLEVQSLYNFTLEFQKVRIVGPDFSWLQNPLTYILSAVIMVALLLTLSGTIYDIYVWKPSLKRAEIEIKCKLNNKTTEIIKTRNIQESSNLLTQDNNFNDNFELKIDNSQHKSIPVHVIKPMENNNVEKSGQSVFAKLSLCFSAMSNMKIIFDTSKVKDELSIIHGLRFFGMIWLIWLYSVFYLKHFADNRPIAQRLSEGFSEHIISNSTFSLDTFFFTSGFSLAFKYYRNRRGPFKKERKFSIKKKVNEFSLMALRRFLRNYSKKIGLEWMAFRLKMQKFRKPEGFKAPALNLFSLLTAFLSMQLKKKLTPVYAVVLGIAIITIKSIRQTSLFEIQEPADEICRKYWWRNFAYINNLYQGDEMCMSWSWYLSTDMQYFLLGVFILILSTRFWKIASAVVVALVIMSSLLTGYLSYGNGYFHSSKPQLALLHVIHYSPWTRVGPYLVGMFTGYFVVHLKQELVFKKSVLITCWMIWFFCNVWALFGLYSKGMSLLSTTVHTALSRTAWGFGLSWIVIACSTKNAGAIKAVLSYPGWIPFSKLSYSAYLLSPLIITMIASNVETAMHFDFIQLVVYFFGQMGIIYFCAFFFSLVLEVPLTTLGLRAVGQKQTQNQLNRQS